MSHQDNSEIDNFYGWLVPNLPKIFDSKSVQNTLSEKLKGLNPELRWEIGPGENAECFLAFSPNLKFELLDFTRLLVSKAPSVPGWEFLPAKPRKKWKNRKTRIKCKGEVVEFIFDEWRYFLTSFNDGEFFDVNLVPVGYDEFEEKDLRYAGDLFVEFELGEELYIEIIDRVNIVRPAEVDCDTDEAQYLYDHLVSEWKAYE